MLTATGTPDPLPPHVVRVLNEVREWTQDEREKFLEAFGDEFCRYCGYADPRCQCWNDE